MKQITHCPIILAEVPVEREELLLEVLEKILVVFSRDHLG